MKTNSIHNLCSVLTLFLLAASARGQGTLYLSNLGEPPIASGAVGSDSWLAEGFITGTNSSGYVLNSAQLLMDEGSLSPIGFTVSIYGSSSNPPYSTFATPGNSLGSLGGPDPATGGLFAYTASGVTLSPRTFYFVVVTADTPVATGAYNWSAAEVALGQSPEQWAVDNVYFSSTDGSNWGASRNHIFQFGIYATAVPEPRTMALAGLGLACLCFWRCNPKSPCAK